MEDRMGKIIVEAEVSLDGVMNGPEYWGEVFKYHSDDVSDYLDKLLFTPNALLLGRMTYEIFAEVWPTRQGKDADRINSMPKFVASRTLHEPLKWNATLMKGDIVEELRKQKQSQDLLQYGVGELTRTMLEHDLVDEFILLIFPFTFAKGPRVFENFRKTSFKLTHTQTFKSGVVALHYASEKVSSGTEAHE